LVEVATTCVELILSRVDHRKSAERVNSAFALITALVNSMSKKLSVKIDSGVDVIPPEEVPCTGVIEIAVI
jgi:hypothetical protein